MTWLCIVQICFWFVPHCFYTVNTTVWVVESDKFETFLKCLPSGDPIIHCVFMKKGNKSTLTDYNSFQDLSGTFSHSKAKFRRKFTPRKQMFFFSMTNIRDIQYNWKYINADYNCLFLSRAHDRNKGKTQKSAKE